MFKLKEYIVVSNFSTPIRRGNHPYEPDEVLNVYDKNGNYKLQIKIDDDVKNIKGLLLNTIKNFNDLQRLKNKELQSLNVDKFWSYKNVLPYSLNIFMNSNLVPKTKTANIVYFVHNIFVFGVILSLLIGFLQNYSSANNKE